MIQTQATEEEDSCIALLPATLRRFGEALYQSTHADPKMIFYSLLGALSTAGSHLINERRQFSDKAYDVGPTNLSIIIIGDSGSLKSAIKSTCFRPMEEFISARMSDYEKRMLEYKLYQRNATAATRMRDSEIQLEDLERLKEPLTPNFMQNNVTIEAVIKLYGKGMPFMSLVSDEGGTFVGSRAMNREAHINTLSAFNTLMSGGVYSKSTVTEGDLRIANRRLTFLMYMQPRVFDAFLEKCGQVADAGFLQRTIIAKTAGGIYVPHRSEESFLFPARDNASSIYNTGEYLAYKNLINSLLDKWQMSHKKCEISPTSMPLSPQADRLWFDFYVKQKKEINKTISLEEFYIINSFRIRASETASKIAALFQLADNDVLDPHHPITLETMSNAITITNEILEEQIQTYEGNSEDRFFADASYLVSFFKKKCSSEQDYRPTLRALMQQIKTSLRKKKELEPVIDYLMEEAILVKEGNTHIYTGRELS